MRYEVLLVCCCINLVSHFSFYTTIHFIPQFVASLVFSMEITILSEVIIQLN